MNKAWIDLSSGAWVVVFPEGTRVAPGYMRKFGIGGARLAVDTGYPVIPVAHDAGKCWPKRGFLKTPGTIKMVIGEKIDSQGQDAAALNQHLFNWMEQKMTVLEGEKPRQQDRK